MIVKIKLIHGDGDVDYIFKTDVYWNPNMRGVGSELLQPQVGMTVILPNSDGKSFRFYISYIVADVRTGHTILVERRSFGHSSEGEKKMLKLAKQLKNWGWEGE